MTQLIQLPATAQGPAGTTPHDRWLSPDGETTAEFHRLPKGYLVRFPDQADFAIDLVADTVRCTPADEASRGAADSLFHNAILPLIGNYRGGLFLHGSAVRLTDGQAVAFLGESRRGKTTLAGAFASASHPFLSEDTVHLEWSGSQYLLHPTRPVLRLFHDSATHLLGHEPPWQDDESKNELGAGEALPFADAPTHLAMICLLGPGDSHDVSLSPINEAEALAQLIRHAFVLDVEDRDRLRGHFDRIGQLVERVPCLSLDYPRRYDQLPAVIGAVVQRAAQGR